MQLRVATIADIPAMEALISASARALSRDVYSDDEIDALIAQVFGVDSEIVADGTYFVAEIDGAMAGCGGWSRRRTLFGGDRFAGRQSGLLDPANEPAKIRAFFVAAAFARRGVGTAILRRCEAEAKSAGFGAIEMMATLPGIKFYEAHGYRGEERIWHVMPDGRKAQFLPMQKRLDERITGFSDDRKD